MGPLNFDHWAFDYCMIDLAVMVLPLSLVFKIKIGDPVDCVDHTIGWKVVAMIWRWQCVWYGFGLMVLCAWHVICYLWWW
jgi:hypothetical protein